jgi:nucleoside-diphosphate-sugar epimerase
MSMADSSRPLFVVLGASGFIGSAVTAMLAARPIRLRVAARRPSVLPVGHRAEAEIVMTDLTGPGELARHVADADAVIHLVAHITGPETWRVSEGDKLAERINLGIVEDLVDILGDRPARTPPPTVVFAGSASQMCQPTGRHLDGTEPDDPVSTYGMQKLAAEQALKSATRGGLLRGVILRLPTVFGQGPASTHRDRGVVATMIRRALAGQPLTMWTDGSAERDLLHVDDAARAMVAALDNADALSGRHWLIGTGQRTRLVDLFSTIAELVAAHSGRSAVPLTRVPAPSHAALTDFHSYAIDASAFRRATGWRPQVQLAAGLIETVAEIASENQTMTS